MSTTTQVLFNSPALHSLKRDQLVKLCKIHSLKASGKNKELIRRLQLHAKTLPPDDLLSIATRSDNVDAKPVADSEDEASDYSREGNASIDNNNTLSRPNEQREVLMETITEVDEETLRSNRGASARQVGEFGTTTSKVSVTSSLKAIATSLGLKRNTSKSSGTASSSSSLSSGEVVQSSSTLPTSDPNGGSEEPTVDPVPGQSNLQGLPAPSAARLSFSRAPATTTIRLVSNVATGTNPELLLSPPKLKPFATSFDLVPATPGGSGSIPVSGWPLSPGGAARESLYPSIPSFQGFGDLHKQQSPLAPHDESDMDLDVDMPGGLVIPSIREPTPQKVITGAQFNTGATPKSGEKPSAEPADIFSPAPKPQVASTRSRFGIPRSEPFVFGSPLLQHNKSNLQFRTTAQSVLDEMNKRLAEEGVEAVDTNVLHNRQASPEESLEKKESNGPLRVADMFEKVHQKEFEKMDSITSHYAAKRGAQSTAPPPILSKKRKSSLVVKERQPGVSTARHRPNGSRVVSSASVKRLPGGFAEEGDEDDELGDRRMSKRPRVEREESDAPAQPASTSRAPSPDSEEEARKQKERDAIRRRLQHNKAKRRSSMGRPSLGRAPPSKPKPARAGFFASAKSIVQNVWNRGAGSRMPSNAPVAKPVQPKGETKTLPRSTEAKKPAVIPGSSGAPPLSSQTRCTPSGGGKASVQPGRSTLAAPTHNSKSLTPSLNPSTSIVVNTGSSTVAGYRPSSRGTSVASFSSLGRKTAPSVNNTRVSSTGAKPDTGASAAAASLQKQASGIPRARTLSTLMAPTASSLAKMNSNVRIPISTNENSTLTRATSSKQRTTMSPQPGATLEQITNSPRSPALSPRPAKVFSQPLSSPSVQPPMSLTSAAATIVGRSAEEKPSSSAEPTDPTKEKVLPGRRPRISRSKVIARLASQRTAGASSSANTGTQRPGGKVRSSMGAEIAGKARQSNGGTKGGDMMGAKKWIRQSEQARRRSRIAGDGQRMEVD